MVMYQSNYIGESEASQIINTSNTEDDHKMSTTG